MTILRLRIIIEETEEVFRDIEIKVNQTFKTFHEAIVECFGVNKEKAASFFISNPRLQKLNEITLGRSSKFDNAIDGLKTRIGSVLPEMTNMLVYVNEAAPQYTFVIEIEKTATEKEDKTYPRCVKKTGTLPSMAPSFTDDIFEENVRLHIDDIFEEPEDEDLF